MSLRNFLEFRTACPICGNPKLSVYFSSKKKQEHIFEQDSYIVKIPLYGINHRRHYDVGYTFSLKDDSFWIDFYTKDNVKMGESFPKFLLNKFKELDSNLKFHIFYKVCNKCFRYNYSCSSVTLNLENGKVCGSFDVVNEYLGLSQKNNDTYKVFRVINSFTRNETFIEYARAPNLESLQTLDDNYMPTEDPPFSTMNLPLLPFRSEEETVNRLNKLIIFS